MYRIISCATYPSKNRPSHPLPHPIRTWSCFKPAMRLTFAYSPNLWKTCILRTALLHPLCSFVQCHHLGTRQNDPFNQTTSKFLPLPKLTTSTTSRTCRDSQMQPCQSPPMKPKRRSGPRVLAPSCFASRPCSKAPTTAGQCYIVNTYQQSQPNMQRTVPSTC